MNFKLTLVTFFALLCAANSAALPQAEEKTLTPEQETEFAQAIFEKENSIAVLRVYGLICESCAYGVNLKLKRVPFVDTSRLDKGIKMDIYNQFLTIALKEDEEVRPNDILKAIEKAGYEAKTLFLMDSIGEIESTGFKLTKTGDASFKLADASQEELLDHGKEHALLLRTPTSGRSAKDNSPFPAYLLDTIHEG